MMRTKLRLKDAMHNEHSGKHSGEYEHSGKRSGEYEHSGEYMPRPPLCPSCAQTMRLARITSRFGDLPDVYTFECRACGVWHVEA
jgi:hypothetical protein